MPLCIPKLEVLWAQRRKYKPESVHEHEEDWVEKREFVELDMSLTLQSFGPLVLKRPEPIEEKM